MNYDIIGDIHGYADKLEELFNKMGYEKDPEQGWVPPKGVITVFLGDFIDRGKQNRDVINIVRQMVDSRNALAVMGNHEYNAICYYTHVPLQGYLRPHSVKNVMQHEMFLREYENDPVSWLDIVEWFMTLPLFLELEDGLRIVHACWDDEKILATRMHGHLVDGRMTSRFLYDSAQKKSPEHAIIETLLKGPETNGSVMTNDPDGYPRSGVRIKWWENYAESNPPVLFGHYWWNRKKGPNVGTSWACVDLSVAKDGELACCQWRGGNGKTPLLNSKFVTV